MQVNPSSRTQALAGQYDILDELATIERAAQPVDEHTAAILDLVAGDHIHAEDRRRIVEAILAVARQHNGQIDPNAVRARLTDDRGNLRVYGRVIGATYNALARRGVIAHTGWTTNNDRAGNAGKPCRTYVLRDWAAAAA